MKIQRGRFKVMRACCTSGNCVECLACWDLSKRKRVMQLDRLSKETAEIVASNWRRYDATVERME